MNETKFNQIKIKSVCLAFLSFIFVCLIGAVVFSLLLNKDDVDISAAPVVINVILALASLISGMTAGLINRCRGIVIGLIISLSEVAILLVISLFLRDNTPIFNEVNIARFFLIIIPAVLGSILGVNLRKY